MAQKIPTNIITFTFLLIKKKPFSKNISGTRAQDHLDSKVYHLTKFNNL
jgi:hypothetical protein